MIAVKNFSLTFGKKKILKDISYEFQPGVTAIVGPSGTGKSSFILSLNRLNDLHSDTIYEGEISFQNKNVLKERKLRNLRHEIGTVFQRPTPFPISIEKNLIITLMEMGIKDQIQQDERIEWALNKVALWNEVKDKLHTSALKLSGGQQQRLCLARTLLTNPKVLILDEPCSSLDPISTLQIEGLIKEVAKEIPVIIVTHNLKQAKRISENLLVFSIIDNVGQIVESGKSAEIFLTPKHEFTKNYLEYEAF